MWSFTCCLALLFAQSGLDPAAAALEAPGPVPAQIGEQHPALELDVLDGTLVNEGRLAGHPFVVDFFATWCEPCHRALGDLLAGRATTTGEPIALVLVDLGESREVVGQWARRAALPPDVLVALDPAGVAARRWGARRLPTTYLVDATGVIRHINRGWGEGYRARMSRWLRDLLAPKSQSATPAQP